MTEHTAYLGKTYMCPHCSRGLAFIEHNTHVDMYWCEECGRDYLINPKTDNIEDQGWTMDG